MATVAFWPRLSLKTRRCRADANGRELRWHESLEPEDCRTCSRKRDISCISVRLPGSPRFDLRVGEGNPARETGLRRLHSAACWRPRVPHVLRSCDDGRAALVRGTSPIPDRSSDLAACPPPPRCHHHEPRPLTQRLQQLSTTSVKVEPIYMGETKRLEVLEGFLSALHKPMLAKLEQTKNTKGLEYAKFRSDDLHNVKLRVEEEVTETSKNQ